MKNRALQNRKNNGSMRAAVVMAPGRVEIHQVPVPEPGPGQVRVRLEGCGVCASNLPVWEGQPWFKYPLLPGALGHEGWGSIDALGPGVTGWQTGERVAFLSGNAYAEHDLAEEGGLLRLPSALEGQPFPGEPLGCALNILRRCSIQPGHTVAILGIGFLGTLLTRLATQAGARVVAISRRRWALKVAKKMGAAETLSIDDVESCRRTVGEMTSGKWCEVTIEATGKQGPLDLAAELTAERGRLVIAGYHQDGPRQINMQLWNWRGLDVVNAHERDPSVYLDGMHRALEAIETGVLDPAPLYTHRFALEQLGQALEATAKRPPGFMKALVSL